MTLSWYHSVLTTYHKNFDWTVSDSIMFRPFVCGSKKSTTSPKWRKDGCKATIFSAIECSYAYLKWPSILINCFTNSEWGDDFRCASIVHILTKVSGIGLFAYLCVLRYLLAMLRYCEYDALTLIGEGTVRLNWRVLNRCFWDWTITVPISIILIILIIIYTRQLNGSGIYSDQLVN